MYLINFNYKWNNINYQFEHASVSYSFCIYFKQEKNKKVAEKFAFYIIINYIIKYILILNILIWKVNILFYNIEFSLKIYLFFNLKSIIIFNMKFSYNQI